MESTNQTITIRVDKPQTLVHELGHLIDRASDGDGELPWSRRLDFEQIIIKYKECLYKGEFTNREKYYYSEDTEIFARLFEEYLSHEHVGLELSHKTSIRPIDLISKFVYESNADIKQYFDTVTQHLHLNKLGLWRTPEVLVTDDLPRPDNIIKTRG